MYEMRKRNNRIEVRDSSKTYNWSLPVMYKGRIYSSVTKLAAVLQLHVASVASALSRGGNIKGLPVRQPNEDEVRQLLLKQSPTKRAPVREPPDIDVRPQIEKEAVLPPPVPFIGIRWPDGVVTVRTAKGPIWAMTKFCMGEVPDEIKENCQWLA
jgi:hypothetical protein